MLTMATEGVKCKTYSKKVIMLGFLTMYVLICIPHPNDNKIFILILVPSQPPSGLAVAASSFTSVLAFWQLPPEDSRHGIIKGYKLFYKETGGDMSSTTEVLINNAAIRSISVTGLQSGTDYDFQVLAFTSSGDGPKSSVEVVRTVVDGKTRTEHSMGISLSLK